MASRELLKAGPLRFPQVNIGVLMGAYSGSGGWWWWWLDVVWGGWSRTENRLGGSGAVGSVGSLEGLAADMVAGGRLEQFPSFLGRQLSQNLFAFTQAHPLQEPDLLHLQHAILSTWNGPWTCAFHLSLVRDKLKCPPMLPSGSRLWLLPDGSIGGKETKKEDKWNCTVHSVMHEYAHLQLRLS